MKQRIRKLGLLFVSAAMIVTHFPSVVRAADDVPKDGEIASFVDLDSSIQTQTVQLGTELSALNLPDKLNAIIYHVEETVITEEEDKASEKIQQPVADLGEDEEGAIDQNVQKPSEADGSSTENNKTETTVTTSIEEIPVTWNSTPAYDGNAANSYVFKADAGEAILSSGAELPQITVIVAEDTAVSEISGINVPAVYSLDDTINELLGMSYFEGGVFIDTFTSDESYADITLYSDLDPDKVYLPTEVRTDVSGVYYTMGTFPNGDRDTHWTKSDSAYISVKKIGEMFDNVAEDIKDKQIRLNVEELAENYKLKYVNGFYDMTANVDSIGGLGLKIGLNESGAPYYDEEGLVTMMNAVYDRVFVEVDTEENTTGQSSKSYQMDISGHWQIDESYDADAEFDGAYAYKLIVNENLKEKYKDKTSDDFDWDAIEAYVQVGYLIKDYEYKQKTINYATDGQPVSIKDVYDQLPKTMTSTFIKGYDYGSKGESFTKSMNIKWKLDTEYNTNNIDSTEDDSMEQLVKVGDSLRFVADIEDLSDRNFFKLGADQAPPEITVNITDKYTPSYDYDSDDENTTKYITKYHVEDREELGKKYRYMQLESYKNYPHQYIAFPNQTLEDIGWKNEVLVDYYTEDGKTGSEWLTLDWEMDHNGNHDSDPYYPMYSDEKGFSEIRIDITEAIMKGSADLGGEWENAPGVEPPEIRILILRNWINIDLSKHANTDQIKDIDLSLVVENGVLTVSYGYYEEKSYNRYGIKGEWYYPTETYDMNNYIGIRLYSSDDTYVHTFSEQPLLTVKDENVNLVLDNVKIERVYSKNINQPIIDIISTKLLGPKALLDPYEPHKLKEGWISNPLNIKAYADNFVINNMWYPDILANQFTSSLNLYVVGKNRIETDFTGGEIIRVPYNAMVAISGLNGTDTELTAIGGAYYTVIGNNEESGHIFVHDVKLNLGKNIELGNTIPFMGTNTQTAPSTAKQMVEGRMGYDLLGNLRLRNFEAKSRPIVISGSKAIVAPILYSKLSNSVRWSEKMTVGTLDLSLDSQLIVKDGATLCTATNYLPPAYSMLNAWKQRQERPFKDSQIIFKYGSEDEYAVKFDTEGTIQLGADVTLKETSRDQDHFGLGVSVKINGMYPLTPLDFKALGYVENFGPIQLDKVNSKDESITELISYKTTGNDLEPLDMQPLERNINVEFDRDIKTGLYEFMLSVSNDFYHLEPVKYSFVEEERPTIIQFRFASEEDLALFNRDDTKNSNSDNPKLTTTISESKVKDAPSDSNSDDPKLTKAAKILMAAYGVNMDDLNFVGINLDRQNVWITKEEQEALTYFGLQRIAREVEAENAKLEDEKRQEELEELLMSEEELTAKRTQEFADKYGVTIEDLEEIGIKINGNTVALLSDEQRLKLQDKINANVEAKEENVLNNYQLNMATGETGATYYVQYVDRLAPSYDELINEDFPQYLFAEVSRKVNGKERIYFELVPITKWVEQFLPIEMKNQVAWQRGYISQDSYALKPNLGFIKANAGNYMFAAELPEEYTFAFGTESAPIAAVRVIESNQTKKSNYMIDQLLDALSGNDQAMANEYVTSEGWLDILINLEEEVSREDVQRQPYYCYLINLDLEYPPDMQEGIYVYRDRNYGASEYIPPDYGGPTRTREETWSLYKPVYTIGEYLGSVPAIFNTNLYWDIPRGFARVTFRIYDIVFGW